MLHPKYNGQELRDKRTEPGALVERTSDDGAVGSRVREVGESETTGNRSVLI